MFNKKRFTQEDLDNMILEALNAQSDKNNRGSEKPNILQLLREKKEQGKSRWPLT